MNVASRTKAGKKRVAGSASWHGMEALESRLLLAAWYVGPTADPLENGSLAHPYNSIQEAITAAAPGDAVNVKPGTYTGDLVLNKANLTLTSTNGAAATTIRGVATEPSANSPLADPNIDIIANGVVLSGFTIKSPDVTGSFYSSGLLIDALNVEIRNNIFQVDSAATGDDVSEAIQTYRDTIGPNNTDLSGLYIHDNTFTSYGTGAAGFDAVWINHTTGDPAPAGDVRILRNTFSGKLVRGITSERSRTVITDNVIHTTLATHLDDANGGTLGGTRQGINVQDYDGRDQANVTILRNVVGGTSAATGFNVGIRVGLTGQSLEGFEVMNNVVAWNATGVRVRTSADGVDVTGNSFTHNTLSVENTDGVNALNASGNWWGFTAAAAVAAQSAGLVDYTPWLGSGADTSAAKGFQGSLSTLYVDDGGEQTGSTGRIQEAVDLVTGSTVYVLAGTYTEDLWISKNGLRLIGAGRNVTTVVGQNTGTPGGGNGGSVVIDAVNVSISDFKFQSGVIAAGKLGTAIYLKGRAGNTAMNFRLFNNEIESRAATVGDHEYKVNGIETDYGNLSGTWIYNNRFTGTPTDGYNGIYVNGAVNGGNVSAYNPLRINSNTFLGNVQRGIGVETSNTQIAWNTIVTSLAVADAWSGIQVQNWQAQGSDAVRNIIIHGNLITGFTWGIKLGMNATSEAGRNETLSGISVISNWIAGGTGGILVRSSANGVVLRYNRLAAISGFAVQNTDPDASTLDARLNWWGDASGPTHATNPSGIGELVSDHVLFTSWLRG